MHRLRLSRLRQPRLAQSQSPTFPVAPVATDLWLRSPKSPSHTGRRPTTTIKSLSDEHDSPLSTFDLTLFLSFANLIPSPLSLRIDCNNCSRLFRGYKPPPLHGLWAIINPYATPSAPQPCVVILVITCVEIHPSVIVSVHIHLPPALHSIQSEPPTFSTTSSPPSDDQTSPQAATGTASNAVITAHRCLCHSSGWWKPIYSSAGKFCYRMYARAAFA